MNWLRFDRENDRLVKRFERVEDASERAEAEQRACEAREATLNAEVRRAYLECAAREIDV